MTLRIAVVCEAHADQQTGCHLADRVICDEIDWMDDDLLDHQRTWCGAAENEEFITWANVKKLCAERRIRPHGHFDGEPGAPDAAATRRALLLVKSVGIFHAVVLLRDDDCEAERRRGIEQARNTVDLEIPIILGLAHFKRECWVLAGFESGNNEEAQRLSEERQKLGYHPNEHPENLSAQDDHDQHSAKRVLSFLTQGDKERERACWQVTALSKLRNRGSGTGLPEFLDEIVTHLVPLFRTRSQ